MRVATRTTRKGVSWLVRIKGWDRWIEHTQNGQQQKRQGSKPMKPETTAIVLIEYQNDFTTPGGVFYAGVKGVIEKNNMLAITIEAAAKGRAAGATIMHAPITFAE